MFGNGRAACGGSILFLMTKKGDSNERILVLLKIKAVCCGAGRSTMSTGSCAAPFASGTARATSTGGLVFALRRSHRF